MLLRSFAVSQKLKNSVRLNKSLMIMLDCVRLSCIRKKIMSMVQAKKQNTRSN